MPQNFEIYAGDDTKLGITVTDANGNPVDITGADIIWEAKRSEASATTVLAKNTATGGGIAITDGPNGVFEVTITDTDSAPLVGLYYHKSVVTLTDDTSTVLTGVLTVLALGTITTSNSYITVEQADEFHGARGNTEWMESDPVDRESWLLEAMDYMNANYVWSGIKTQRDQPLDWPRAYVYDEDGYYIDSDVTPQEILDAQALLADYARTGPLLTDVAAGGQVKRDKVDVLETEWFQGSPTNRTFPLVDRLLAPYVDGSAGGASVKLMRV